MAVYSYFGVGSVYAGSYAGGDRMRRIGNCSNLEVAISEETKDLKDWENPGGGIANTVRRIDKIEVKMTMHDLSPENLAMAVFGDASSVAGDSVTDEVKTAYRDGLVRLEHVNPSAVVVTNSAGSTTYVEGEDYEIKSAGLFIPVGSAITDGQSIKVDYTYPAQNVIQAVLNSGAELTMTFDGINEANDDKPRVVDLYRVRFGPASSMGYIGDDFAKLELTGMLLKDANRTGAGISQYFKETMAA